jgi:protease I
MELFFPYFRLLEEGLEVDIAAPERGHIEGEHGYGLEIQKTFNEVNPENYDFLLIPGDLPAFMRETMRMINRIKK